MDDTLEWRVDTSLEAVLENIAADIQPVKFYPFYLPAGHHKEIKGKVGKNRIRLHRKSLFTNCMSPLLYARLLPDAGGGCRVVGRFKVYPWVSVMMYLVFILASLYISLYAIPITIVVMDQKLSLSNLVPYLVMPVGALFGFAALLQWGQCVGQRDKEAIVAFLNTRLGVPAQPIQEDSVEMAGPSLEALS